MSKKTVILIVVLVVIMPLTVWNVSQFLSRQPTFPPELQGILWPEPKPLRDFTLVNQHKQPFNLQHLEGKWTLMFFGYTYCPDICPTSMLVLKTVYEHLQQKLGVGFNLQIVFVSVDPARDTTSVLLDYLGYFSKDFIGVTGTTENIDGLTRQIGAGYMQQPADKTGNYQVNHTGTFFLIDPQARLYAGFPQPHIPKTIVGQFLQIRSIW